MSARIPRRAFAPSLVITMAAGSLAACGNPPRPGPAHYDPPANGEPTAAPPTTYASWKIHAVGDGTCTAAQCTPAVPELSCPDHGGIPYPCMDEVPDGAVVVRTDGSPICEYNTTPYVAIECPDPLATCNPPPSQWTPIAVPCPDGPR